MQAKKAEGRKAGSSRQTLGSTHFRPISFISFHFRNDTRRAKFHQYKAASHTWKTTTGFFEKIKIDANIEYEPFQHNPANSSDISHTVY